MKNKNILLFVATLVLFIIIIKNNVPSLILSNKSEYKYAGTTISDSGNISPTRHEFELKEAALMKFKIASVTDDSDLKVELVSNDTGKKLLELNDRNLTHAEFKELKPGKYTFVITSFSNPTAYNYILELSNYSNHP